MLDENYQKEIIEKYESIKHSVNIPHLLSKVPHFNEYLKLQLIPQAFFNVASVSYRTLYRYRKNVYADNNNEAPVSLFNFFGVDGKKDKEAILRGFENMINFKMFAKWAYIICRKLFSFIHVSTYCTSPCCLSLCIILWCFWLWLNMCMIICICR